MDNQNSNWNVKKKKQLLYLEVHERIKEIIKEENLAAGDKLPSESELVTRLGVSRGTVRQALMLLCEGGIIYNNHHKGHFIAKEKENTYGVENINISLLQFSHVDIERGELIVDYAPSTKSMRESYLDNSEATLLARFHFQYYYNGTIIAYQHIFVPFKQLEEDNVALESIEAMTEFIDDLIENRRVSAETTIDCVEIREEIAKKMNAQEGTWVYSITEASRNKSGLVIAYSTLYCYPEYFKFKINRTQSNI